jgi:iron complex outermembrane receptor protein
MQMAIIFNGIHHQLKSINWLVETSLIEQKKQFGTSYRVSETFRRNIKCIFTRNESGSQFGYDQLTGRSYGNTDANYLNGVAGSGYNNTYENTNSRSKLMDRILIQ